MPLKAVGTTAFMWLFFIGYFHTLREPAFPVTVMPRTPLDDWIGLQPWSLWPYLSLWFYVSLPPALMPDRASLVRYGIAVGLLLITGLALFWAFPTAVPPSDIDVGAHPGFALLQGLDAAGNACPSMHVASAAFAALWLARHVREMGLPRWTAWLNWIWFIAIAWSTVATRQHVVVDVIGGLVLGGLAGWASLRWIRTR
jgi:membrane-associated phospholipid phosphatase